MRQAGNFFGVNGGGKADQLVVAGMNLEQGGGVGGDGRFVIAPIGLVRGAHLDEADAAGRHDLGKAKRAADFHQLPPRNDDFFAGRTAVEKQKNGGGIVVHHHRRFSSGQFTEKPFQVSLPRTAHALFQVHLQVAVAFHD